MAKRSWAAVTAGLGVVLGGCDSISAPAGSIYFEQQATKGPMGEVLQPAPRVVLRDESGATDLGADARVTITLQQPGLDHLLLGTTEVAAVGGVAVFDDLRIDSTGDFRLLASAPGFGDVGSTRVRIFPRYTTVAAGSAHACASTLAGNLFCWGSNGNGQLGIPTTSASYDLPQEVVNPDGTRFTAAAAGAAHSCALTEAGGVHCWGSNLFHQLGDGTGGPYTPGVSRTVPAPVLLPPGQVVERLAAVADHSCVVTTSGAAYCWGVNPYGQLGDGTTAIPLVPVAVQSPSGESWSMISPGLHHTCGLTSAGTAYCWGLNEYGALGDGTVENRLIPTAVVMPAGVRFASISAAGGYSCALSTAGAVYCWGRTGVVGHRYNTPSTPAPVLAPAGVTFVALDVDAARCALTEAGQIYCGSGDPFANPPVLLSTPDGVRFVSLDVNRHGCAVTERGIGYCWGPGVEVPTAVAQ